MAESIKKTMIRLYGVGTIPKKVPAEEMRRLIEESKLQLRAKKSKSAENKKPEDIEKGCMENYPCTRCKEARWMKVPDDSGRYYCLKCGEVIQYTDIESAKEKTELHKPLAPISKCDEAEKKADQINSVAEPIPETGNKELVYCEYRCNDCQEIVVACGNSLKKAKNLVAFHKDCGGTLIFVRQINPKLAANKERFSHPKVEKAVCNDCFDDMGCPRSFKRIIACLLRDIGYNIRKTRSD